MSQIRRIFDKRRKEIGALLGILILIHLLSEATGYTNSYGSPRSGVAKTSYLTADDYLPHIHKVIEARPVSLSEAASGCRWGPLEDPNFQFAGDNEWKTKYDEQGVAKKRSEWHKFMRREVIPYKTVAGRFNGRGIVVTAGNDLTLMRLQVLLRALAIHGSALPVEVHYWAEELNTANKTILQGLYPNIAFQDLSDKNNIIKSSYNTLFPVNYNLKIASILNSRFAEPILLDSDNVPVADPAALYDSRVYKNFGTVFYPDIARTRPDNPAWPITNTRCVKNEFEQESGQLVIDKTRFWYHLQLANHFATTDGYMDFILGDKDCFRFAWHALRTPYGIPDRWITSVGFVGRPVTAGPFPEGMEGAANGLEYNMGGPKSAYCGHTFGQHHPDGHDAPILFLHGGLLKTLSKQMIQHVRAQSGGLFTAYKRSERANRDHAWPEKVYIRYHNGDVYLDPAVVKHAAQCTNYEWQVPRVAGDANSTELAGIEKLFERAGGFWMLDMERDTF